MADALVLQLTGRRSLAPEDFRPRGEGVRMTPRARRRFLEGYESKAAQSFRLRAGEELTLRDAVRAQALRLANAIREGGGYVPFELP